MACVCFDYVVECVVRNGWKPKRRPFSAAFSKYASERSRHTYQSKYTIQIATQVVWKRQQRDGDRVNLCGSTWMIRTRHLRNRHFAVRIAQWKIRRPVHTGSQSGSILMSVPAAILWTILLPSMCKIYTGRYRNPQERQAPIEMVDDFLATLEVGCFVAL